MALALDPAFAMSQYAKSHWNVEHGLPQNYVTSLVQAPTGEILVGTSGGVARFDGVNFEPVVLNPRTGLTREWINALAVDTDGSVWIATRDAGLFVERPGSVANHVREELVLSTLYSRSPAPRFRWTLI